MKKRNITALLLISFLILISAPAFAQKTATGKKTVAKTNNLTRPNIILILADDLGIETLGCYGGTSYKTPHLDSLAAMGMRFTQAYATPLCTPSRLVLMTGKYNFRNYKAFGYLPAGEKTFGHLMKANGYATGVFGKWQLNGMGPGPTAANPKPDPSLKGSTCLEAGFDEYAAWFLFGAGSRYKDPVISTSAGTRENKNEYGPDMLEKYAETFITEHRNQPFFLYYPMVLPHDPFQPTPDMPAYKDFDASKRGNDTANYPYMINYMDKLVGKLINKVREEGIEKRTLIIFIGDNGTDKNIISYQNGTAIRGDKGFTTNYGTHVPMIAYWPGVIKPGQINNNLIDFTDFIPTFSELTKMKIPKGFILDGTSFYSQLMNAGKGKHRQWIYDYYDPKWGRFKADTWVQNEYWKLYKDGRIYNLKNDPKEINKLDYNRLNSSTKKTIDKFRKVIEGYVE
ncbi:MAG: sulfatase-like hydrolase/transferase [Nitrosopumilus sp.]|nr:sulfatase-like hydrolase/transferase [Nitrosopumilus sp.]